MKFVTKEPSLGNQLRVDRGLYYHHGIYIGDNKVIQFGSTTGELDPSKAMVIETSLEDFLKDGVLEVAEYNDDELKELRSPEKIVEAAKSRLGETGYNIVSNNCEHFSNECAFGKKKSAQVDNVLSLLQSLLK